jgi:glutathione S-transferase
VKPRLKLYMHPLSSYCQKALVALYENATPFEPVIVNLMDQASAAAFKQMWPIGKFPVLRDEDRDQVIPESTVIIEYLDQYYPGTTRFIPADPDAERLTRARDRFIDLYIHMEMQKVVGDRLRPQDRRDPLGVEQARTKMHTALSLLDRDMTGQTWAMGEAFSLADCSACPALYYANLVMPLGEKYPNVAGYFERLLQRPSFARAVKEAEPYRHMFPKA